MATSKQYAWYLEGNQVAIVEKDVSFDNDLTSKDYGPGASRQRWESPQSSVTDGLEVKYVYAPNYRINSIASGDKETLVSYESTDGKLTLNGTSFSTESSVDYIVITGSDKWNGLHKVTAVNTAWYKLDTEYNGAYAAESAVIYTDVSALVDESFELDLPLYLQKALVYYVKAKLAEDGGNIELREYNMREFKKMTEKHENSRISGLRITSSGSHAIR
jgi:translation initiation factor 2 alpha subunit (eIF-2alpha)